MKYLLHDKGIRWFRDTLCATCFTGTLKGLRMSQRPSFWTISAGTGKRRDVVRGTAPALRTPKR